MSSFDPPRERPEPKLDLPHEGVFCFAKMEVAPATPSSGTTSSEAREEKESEALPENLKESYVLQVDEGQG